MSDKYWSQENVMGTGAGIASCVKILDNMLVFGAFDNFVYALNPDDGKIVWKYHTNGPVYSTPAVYKNHVYAGSCDGFLYCLSCIVWIAVETLYGNLIQAEVYITLLLSAATKRSFSETTTDYSLRLA